MVVIGKRYKSWQSKTTAKNRLKELRVRFHLSQYELGKVLSVAHNTIFYWEHSKVSIKKEYLHKLSELFKVPVDYILGATDEDCYCEETIRAVQDNVKEALLEAEADGYKNTQNKKVLEKSFVEKQMENVQTTVPKQNALKMLRKQKKVSQSTLSKQLGIDITAISYWEHGLYEIDDESLAKLAAYFNVTPQAILQNSGMEGRTGA